MNNAALKNNAILSHAIVRRAAPALALSLSLVLGGCAEPKTTETAAAPTPETTTEVAPTETTSAETANANTETAADIEAGSTLRVISHESFNLSDGMLEQFEDQYGVNVERIEAGNAGEMLNRLILTKEAPIADVVYGLDNSMLPRAKREGILQPYHSPAASNIPEKYQLGSGDLLNTVDYGVVALNYDREAWKKTGLPLPTTLQELAQPEYASKLVVPSPSTSSPGLAFLLATVNELGQQDAWKWWNTALDNGMKLTSGWSEAYYTEFTRAGGKYPLVLSYATSPAAEVYYAEDFDPNNLPEKSPTANLFIDGTTYLQLEGVGILKGTQNEAAAKAFVDWMLSKNVQADIPTNMWVYPAVEGIPLNPVFDLVETTDVPPVKAELTDNPQAILDAWIDNVQRN